MSLVTILLVGFFLLGMLLGPLSLAVLVRSLSDERSRDLGDWAVGLGLKSVWRPALTFNAANELALKRRSYDEEHDEQKITFGGLFSSIERFLFDPQDRLHNWFGTPFGFVDERFGIIFDPRDAVVGGEMFEAQQAGTYQQRVERGQRLVESVQAVFEVPGRHAGVNLSNVWTLIGGSFDSQLVRKVHEFYQKSQAPKADTTALRQLLVPVGAFIAVLLIGVFASGDGGGGSNAAAQAGNDTTIEYGWTLLLLAAPAISNRVQRDTIVKLVFGGLILGLAALLYIVFPMWVPVMGIALPLGVWAIILMAVGAAVMPVIAAWFGRSLGGLGMLLGKLYITIGLLPYDRPVITLVDGKEYELREYDEYDWPIKPQFYRFAMTRLGVGLANNPDVWGDDVALSPAAVDAMGVTQEPVVADGGVSAPTGWTPTDVIKHEDIWGYVPEDVDDDAQYVRTDLTTGWFIEAGQNRRLMTAALESAKEQYGGGNKPVGDKWVLGSTLFAMLMGAIFNWLVLF